MANRRHQGIRVRVHGIHARLDLPLLDPQVARECATGFCAAPRPLLGGRWILAAVECRPLPADEASVTKRSVRKASRRSTGTVIRKTRAGRNLKSLDRR